MPLSVTALQVSLLPEEKGGGAGEAIRRHNITYTFLFPMPVATYDLIERRAHSVVDSHCRVSSSIATPISEIARDDNGAACGVYLRRIESRPANLAVLPDLTWSRSTAVARHILVSNDLCSCGDHDAYRNTIRITVTAHDEIKSLINCSSRLRPRGLCRGLEH